MKYECMSPLFLSTTYRVSPLCIAVGWNIDACPLLELWMQNVIYPLQGKLCLSSLSTGDYMWCFDSWSVLVTSIHHLTGWIHESLDTKTNLLDRLEQSCLVITVTETTELFFLSLHLLSVFIMFIMFSLLIRTLRLRKWNVSDLKADNIICGTIIPRERKSTGRGLSAFTGQKGTTGRRLRGSGSRQP